MMARACASRWARLVTLCETELCISSRLLRVQPPVVMRASEAGRRRDGVLGFRGGVERIVIHRKRVQRGHVGGGGWHGSG